MKNTMTIKEFNGVDSFDVFPDGTKLSHEDKYGNVVKAIGLSKLARLIPVKDKETLTQKFNEDRNLNNVPLKLWNNQEYAVKSLLCSIGINVISLSDCVCTLKCAAKLWIKEDNA